MLEIIMMKTLEQAIFEVNAEEEMNALGECMLRYEQAELRENEWARANEKAAKDLITLKEKEEHSIYRPSIDFVMRDMAQRFGKNCNAIIFSGMGNDGERGCHVVAAECLAT